MKRGIVYLVGAGPGRADLITVAGQRRLARADVVVHDRLIDTRLLDAAPAHAERIFAGKRCGEHAGPDQGAINELLIDRARLGQCVVRLKGGDALTFARGGEEAQALDAAGIQYEIVPGVTAANAVAACASIPLTHRGVASAVLWFTGHEDPSKTSSQNWANLASFQGTLLAYMGVTRITGIAQALVDAGKDGATPVAIIEWGGVNRQRVAETTLGNVAAGETVELSSPALTVIGEVVRVRKSLGWFERRPLFGQKVLVLRPSRQAAATADRLEELGADVAFQPVVEIAPPADWHEVDAAIRRLRDFDWLAFTSPNGVDSFLGRLVEAGGDLRQIGHCKLAAIGPGTAAALARWHLRFDFVPDEFHSEALAIGLAERVAGQRVLMPRADRGRKVLENELASVAARVERIVAYRQVDIAEPDSAIVAQIVNESTHWILLTSTNIALGFLAWANADERLAAAIRGAGGARLASISPVTSAAIVSAGFVPNVEAAVHTPDGLVDAIVAQVVTERLGAVD